jgi:hypothetical protein
MRLSPSVKAVLAVPLALANTFLLLVAAWLILGVFVMAIGAWWLALIVAVVGTLYLGGLVAVSTEHLRHPRDVRDPQKVLVCAFQSLWVNVAGVVLGYLLVILLLLFAAIAAAH